MRLRNIVFLGIMTLGLMNNARAMKKSLKAGNQPNTGAHLNPYAQLFIPGGLLVVFVEGLGLMPMDQIQQYFTNYYASKQRASASPQAPVVDDSSGLATVASLRDVLTAARESIHNLAGRDLDLLGKKIFDFLECFVKECYFPAILNDLEGREAPKTWSDVFQEAINMKQSVQKSYDESLHGFYDVVMNELSCTEDCLSERFNSVAPLFFKALFDVFSSRGFGVEFTYWFYNATPYFYELSIEQYPELKAPDGAYFGTAAFPVERGLLRVAQSMAGHVGAGLDDLDTDLCEQSEE